MKSITNGYLITEVQYVASNTYWADTTEKYSSLEEMQEYCDNHIDDEDLDGLVIYQLVPVCFVKEASRKISWENVNE